jgi:hypothetical protein
MTDMELLLVGVGILVGVFSSVLIAVLWKVVLPWAWPITVPLMKRRGEGFVWDLGERAKKIKRKDGFECLKLMKNGEEIREPEYEFLQTTDKGKPVYPIYSPIKGQYSRLRFGNKPPRVEFTEDKASKNWGIDMLRRAEAKYADKQSWFDKYGTFVMSMTLAVVIIFIVIFSWGKFETVSNSLSGAADNLAVAIAKFSAFQQPGGAVIVQNSTVLP